MATKVTSGVPKTFDEQLEAFISFLKTNKISGLGIDIKQMETDLKTQRDSRQRDLEAQRQYERIHREHLVGQSDRYARYMTALSVVRGAYRKDQSVLRSLEQFKRPRTSRTPKPKKS